jgi:RNA polymerase sigma factor (sigma-70 family)
MRPTFPVGRSYGQAPRHTSHIVVVAKRWQHRRRARFSHGLLPATRRCLRASDDVCRAAEMSPPRITPDSADGESARTSSLERLYRAQAPSLARYFRRHLRGSDDVPDLVQETFARLARARTEHPQRPVAYLRRIARNLLIDRARRRDSGLSHFHLEMGDHLGLSTAPEQERALEADDVLRLYRRALDQLPPKTRTAFLLHRIDDLSYKEIAAEMAISIPTVQYHVARALMHIDEILDQG